MKKYLIVLLATLFCLIAPQKTFSASIVSVEPKVFEVGEKVTISGSGFKLESSTYSNVCWNGSCIDRKDIKFWGDNKIIFELNTTEMDTTGLLNVMYRDEIMKCDEDDKCKASPAQGAVEGIGIKVRPHVDNIMINDEEVSVLSSGKTAVINGSYFGDIAEKIIIGDHKITDFESWNEHEIVFTVPEITEETSCITIYNSIGASNQYDIWTPVNYGDNEYSGYQDYLRMIGFDAIYQKISSYSSSKIVVAVIDSGVYWNHEDLKNNIYEKNGRIVGYNFIKNSDNSSDLEPYNQHGTQVAGIIAAEDNAIDLVGIAPNTKIMPLIVVNENGATAKNISDAIYFAVDNGADIIHLSSDIDGYTDNFDEAIEYAHRHDIVIVSAAGNGNQTSSIGKNLNFDANKTSPACNDLGFNAVIGVSSFDNEYQKSSFADYGSDYIDISAKGEDIATLHYGEESHSIVSGTSFAASQVTGAIALFKSKHPYLKPWEIAHYLKTSSTKLDNDDDELGGALSLENFLNKKINKSNIKAPSPQIKGYLIKDQKMYITGEFFQNSSSISLEYTDQDKASQKRDTTVSKATYSWLISFNLPDDFSEAQKITVGNIGGRTTAEIEDLQKLKSKDLDVSEISNDSIETTNDDEEEEEEEEEEEDEKEDDDDFSDVSGAHQNRKAIQHMKKNGIINGYSDATFRPSNPVNRAELLKILIEANLENADLSTYSTNCFSDVNTNDWFAPYVCYAKEQGWIKGYQGNTFRPAQSVSKAEAVKIILVAYGFEIPTQDIESYFDDVNISDWFTPYLHIAHNNQFLELKSGKYAPNKAMTRANVSQIIYNVMMFSE